MKRFMAWLRREAERQKDEDFRLWIALGVAIVCWQILKATGAI